MVYLLPKHDQKNAIKFKPLLLTNIFISSHFHYIVFQLFRTTLLFVCWIISSLFVAFETFVTIFFYFFCFSFWFKYIFSFFVNLGKRAFLQTFYSNFFFFSSFLLFIYIHITKINLVCWSIVGITVYFFFFFVLF